MIGLTANGIAAFAVTSEEPIGPDTRVIYAPDASEAELAGRLAEFYSRRSLTRQAIHPDDCARAILFLAGPHARCTTGHLLPVDGGLTDAFLR